MHADMTYAVSLALFGMLVLLFPVAFLASFLPDQNRYQHLLAPLTRRLGVSVGLTIMAAPAQLFTNEGWLYDMAALAAALFYWWTFIDTYLLGGSVTPTGAKGPVIDGTPAAAFQATSDTGPTY